MQSRIATSQSAPWCRATHRLDSLLVQPISCFCLCIIQSFNIHLLPPRRLREWPPQSRASSHQRPPQTGSTCRCCTAPPQCCGSGGCEGSSGYPGGSRGTLEAGDSITHLQLICSILEDANQSSHPQWKFDGQSRAAASLPLRRRLSGGRWFVRVCGVCCIVSWVVVL